MKTFLFSILLAATSLSAMLPAPALAQTDPVVKTNVKVFQLNRVRRKDPMQVQVLIDKYRPVKVWVAQGEALLSRTLKKKRAMA